MCSVFKTLEIIFLFCTCLYIGNGEQTSSQRKSRCLSGKLHCLNFVFPSDNETLPQSASVMKRRRCPFRCRRLRSLIKNWKQVKITQQLFIRLHFVLKYIVYRLDTGRSRVAPYPLGIIFVGFISLSGFSTVFEVGVVFIWVGVARPGGPCSLGGCGGMPPPPQKILNF